ncbi:MAG: response regulator [Anaerolineae bacterium]|nr:response regulator [Anaerolineae bacterium]
MDNKPKIVIIDDEEVVLDSCTQILEGGDYEVATAPDGTLGLELIEDIQPDLVFVDLKMPGISGFEVLQRVCDLNPTIVTVVITGYATVDSAVGAMKQGAYDFLPKPFTPDEFRLITRRGLERRKLTLETIALRREKEMLRENFAAIVSHELKSPLGAMQQNLYALVGELSGSITESQQARLERMVSRTDDLLKLIHSWLRILSVDIRKIQESFAPISIQPLISKALESVEPHAVRKDVDIVTSIIEPLSPIEGEEISFVEALVNIIGNAVKYSYSGSQVSVNIEQTNDDIDISISDTGVGISKEELPRLFGDFYKGQSGHAVEGSHGLGLTISRRIIEAHNGTISVESEPGKGTTFVIKIPTLKQTE